MTSHLTPFLTASARSCKNSLVFSGSWPATIFDGRADTDLPVTIAERKNPRNCL